MKLAIHLLGHHLHGQSLPVCGRDRKNILTTTDRDKVTCKICLSGGVSVIRRRIDKALSQNNQPEK
jgi:hypothetical protein